MKQIHVVGAAIFHNRLLLCARRSPTMPLPGTWEFPGGKLEPDESPQQALARELLEELRITAQVGDFIATGSHKQTKVEVVLDVYACRMLDGMPVALEHDLLKWCDKHELRDLDWAPADLPAVDAILERWETLIE